MKAKLINQTLLTLLTLVATIAGVYAVGYLMSHTVLLFICCLGIPALSWYWPRLVQKCKDAEDFDKKFLDQYK